MIFNDGSRTSGKTGYNESEWCDKVIDSSRVLHLARIEMLYDREDSRLMGLRFWDKDDCVLVETEDFE
jgi:hypothetical protein